MITVKQSSVVAASYGVDWVIDSGTITSASTSYSGDGSMSTVRTANYIHVHGSIQDGVFYYGTSDTKTVTGTFSIETSDYGTLTGTGTVTLAYDGNYTFTLSRNFVRPLHFSSSEPTLCMGETTLYSTQYIIGNPPVYVDLDIGEAYIIKNGEIASANNGVYIPPELPTLAPGNTTITYDNTFTQVDIIPRWWKI